MSQRLFNTDEKIPVFLDDISPKLEKRNGDDIKVADLTLRVQPLTVELAAALDPMVRRTLYRMNDGSQNPDLKSVEFRLKPPRQLLTIFASTDTETPTIALDHVDIVGLKARTEKGVDGWALVFHATYGPVGKTELEFFYGWYTKQQAITFDEAAPMLDFEEGTDADVKAQQAVPDPMFDDDRDQDPSAQATTDAKRSKGINRKLHSHQAKKRGRRGAEGARA